MLTFVSVKNLCGYEGEKQENRCSPTWLRRCIRKVTFHWQLGLHREAKLRSLHGPLLL